MDDPENVVIAGAGIAGLTAALAFAARGFRVELVERADSFGAIGAGLQLSPNATHLLGELGLLEQLRELAVQPDAVVLRRAAALDELARVRLGAYAEERWGAPYLVVHRADLHAVLARAVEAHAAISLRRGTEAVSVDSGQAGAALRLRGAQPARGVLVVGADGVWSALRSQMSATPPRFSGRLAWRAVVPADSEGGSVARALDGGQRNVVALLHPGAHLVIYPVQSGCAYNLVAFSPGSMQKQEWEGPADKSLLLGALRGADAKMIQMIEAASWTTWPVYTVNPRRRWTQGNVALVGDAAHAMSPYAAQGAAMAIEDAVTLSYAASAPGGSLEAGLRQWEAERRHRVLKVARRGVLNRLAWHAGGPAGRARDLFLQTQSPERLAQSLDWLYGWVPAE